MRRTRLWDTFAVMDGVSRVARLLGRASLVDLAFGLALATATMVELALTDGRDGPVAVQVVALLLMTLPVAFRRTAPLLAVALVSVGVVTFEQWGGEAPVVGGFLGVIVTTYSLGRYASARALSIGAVAILLTFVPSLLDPAERSFGDFVGNLVIVGVLVGLGRAVRVWRDRAESAEERALRAEREREEGVRAAIEEERLRIARELHDIVAHNVSVMVLQAGAARQVVEDDPARAETSLAAIEKTGRETLNEMRRLLGILRRHGDELSVGPPVGLAQIDVLAEQLRDAGVDVEVKVEGQPHELAPSLDVSAYRVVQEGVTNVLKHAGAGSAVVRVRYLEDRLELEVLDDGAATSANGAGGYGLVGMRERLAVFGGTLAAQPRPEGGFALRASIPLPQASK